MADDSQGEMVTTHPISAWESVAWQQIEALVGHRLSTRLFPHIFTPIVGALLEEGRDIHIEFDESTALLKLLLGRRVLASCHLTVFPY